MDFKQIQNIIKDFENSNITTLELEMENLKLKLNKNDQEIVKVSKKSVVIEEETPNVEEETSGYEVKSPLVGTFYAASSPKDEPFVKVGQSVEKGDTLCIVEAMKIMNEITAPVGGVIESIQLKNGEAIGFDQVIMTIR